MNKNLGRVLVTGAPGWLGNRVVKGLLGGLPDYPDLPRATAVRCLVLPGMDTSSLRFLKGLEFIEGDVTKADTLKGVAKDYNVVIHCAGIIHPSKIKDLYEVNTKGTKNILDEAITSGAKRFIFVSSNSVAGTNISKDRLFKESDPYNPYKGYGKSKKLAEDLVNEAGRSGKIETIIARGCWFYGPDQPARQTEFFNMIKSGKPPLFGNGSNLRSMSYVDNLASGLILASVSEKAPGNTYWLADEKPYETTEIYRTVADLLGVKKLNFLKIPGIACAAFEMLDGAMQLVGLYHPKIHVAGEMNKNIACSIDKAKTELGYNPKVSLREGMKRSIEWCRENGVEI